MQTHTAPASAAIGAGLGILAILSLSLVFGALASPAGVAFGAAAGMAVAYRERRPLDSRSFRIGSTIVVIASAAVIWLSVQPGYGAM
jgi:hypothetical protein